MKPWQADMTLSLLWLIVCLLVITIAPKEYAKQTPAFVGAMLSFIAACLFLGESLRKLFLS